ncbi:MAG: hypothetical protein AAF433_03920 [Bacteroidota bacterium]
MARRKKITGFARLIIALLIIVPGAFIGASYINGEDPVQKFKELAGWEASSSSSSRTSAGSSNNGNTRGSTNENVINDLHTRIAILEEELARCKTRNVE